MKNVLFDIMIQMWIGLLQSPLLLVYFINNQEGLL